MSYRPSNYTSLQIKKSGVVSVVSSSYTGYNTAVLVGRAIRYLDPNMILYLSVPSTNNGGIFLASDDLIPSATIVSQNSTFKSVSNLFDHDDSTYAYDSGTLAANTEQAEIVLNLGKTYSTGFIYVNHKITTTGLYTKIYISPDNSTWTQIYYVGGAANVYSNILRVSNTQYIKLSLYNSNSSSITLTGSWYAYSLEFYPLPAPRTSVQGNGTVGLYTACAYNTYYELLEVWNI